FSLSSVALHRRALDRRLESLLVRRSGDGKSVIWYRRRHARAVAERDPARRLHVWLPRSAPRHRRIPRSTFAFACLLPSLSLRELLQPPPHALGVAQPFLGWLQRSLRAALLDGDLV